VIPLNVLGVSGISLVLVKTAHPTPIWRNPLAAAANPALRALLMFQVATEKVLLPPGRGSAGETNIIVYSLLIKLIINQKTNGRISSTDSRAFTMRTSGPSQSLTSALGRGGEYCLMV
jgi:hypothetical protein